MKGLRPFESIIALLILVMIAMVADTVTAHATIFDHHVVHVTSEIIDISTVIHHDDDDDDNNKNNNDDNIKNPFFLQHILDVAPSHATIWIPHNVTVITAPIVLKSNNILQVDGLLQAISVVDQLELWPKQDPLITYGCADDGGFTMQYQAFIYAVNVTNVRITGTGTIDGQGYDWWDCFKNHTSTTSLEAGRPNLIQIVNSTNIELDSVSLQNSPFWTVHPVLCDGVYIHDLTITAPLYAPNVDGIDPDSCRNVLIEYCNISVGDDHIAIKAGVCNGKGSPNQCTDPIWTHSHVYATDNITVRYNTFRTGMGVAIGSESSGSIRNVHITGNTIGLCQTGSDPTYGCGWGVAMHIKSTMTRGGVIENIVFDNNLVYNTSMFLLLELTYQESHDHVVPTDYTPTRIQNISFISNYGYGSAVGATFDCTAKDVCQNLILHDNVIHNAGDINPWNCHFIASYTVANNFPSGLENCMKHSMEPNDSTMR